MWEQTIKFSWYFDTESDDDNNDHDDDTFLSANPYEEQRASQLFPCQSFVQSYNQRHDYMWAQNPIYQIYGLEQPIIIMGCTAFLYL